MLDYLLQLLKFFWSWIVSSIFGPVITMDDSGIRVRCQNQIAEGGFSVIFLATDLDSSPNKYVLKRIRCHDSESRSACVKESKVHYAMQKKQRQQYQKNGGGIISAGGGGSGGGIPGTTTESINDSLSSHFMPLLGTTFCENNTVCYMLFPYISHSLRKEVDRRIFQPFEEVTNGNRSTMVSQSQKNKNIKDALIMPPWSETVVLRWFEQLIDAVILMHDAGYTHRDIKIDNVLLHPEPPANNNYNSNNSNNSQSGPGPILMDFGSAGPLTRPITTRRDVLNIADDAAINTTISYRPPELFAGELRVADSTAISSSTSTGSNDDDVNHELVLDYRKVDVWMLGCTLFAILFGASPGEVEFSRSTGKLIIVDPSHNKVLGPIPWPNDETPPAYWYSKDVKELLEWILTQSRCDRPTVKQVRVRVRELLSQQPTFFHDGDVRMATDIENQQMDISYATKNIL
jgi:serine/threonine kinase 16